MNNTQLIEFLGNTALIEGRFYSDVHGSLLNDYIDLSTPKLIIEQAYYDHSRFRELADNNIDTIIINEPFAFQDKIFDAYKAIIEVSKITGWKPKRLINTMEYGKEGLFLMCSQVNIDFYNLEYNFDNRIEFDTDFALHKIELTDKEIEMAKMRNSYID